MLCTDMPTKVITNQFQVSQNFFLNVAKYLKFHRSKEFLVHV